jgi:dienelactone hydrolase
MPSLGHHHHLVKSLAAKAVRPLSFLSGNYPNQEMWRGFARKKVFELLHYAPPRVAFREEIIDETDCEGYVRQELWFSSSQYTRVSAYLLRPRVVQGKLPGIVCLHDHGGLFAWGKEKLVATPADKRPALAEHKETKYSGLSVADEFAKAGFAVLVIDSFYFGGRRLMGVSEVDELDLEDPEQAAAFERIAREHEPVAALDLLQAGATLMGMGVWDAIRAVEFLTTIDGIDGRRIGLFGSFSGGLMAIYVTGLYDLVRATCAAGWVTSLGNLVRDGVPGTEWCHYAVPGLHNFLDLPDIACMTVPRALFLMAMEKDPIFPGARAANAFDRIRQVYRDADQGDDFFAQTYAGSAAFTPQMLSDTLRWFQRWL